MPGRPFVNTKQKNFCKREREVFTISKLTERIGYVDAGEVCLFFPSNKLFKPFIVICKDGSDGFLPGNPNQ